MTFSTRVLDPIDLVSEVLFGLIMVLESRLGAIFELRYRFRNQCREFSVAHGSMASTQHNRAAQRTSWRVRCHEQGLAANRCKPLKMLVAGAVVLHGRRALTLAA